MINFAYVPQKKNYMSVYTTFPCTKIFNETPLRPQKGGPFGEISSVHLVAQSLPTSRDLEPLLNLRTSLGSAYCWCSPPVAGEKIVEFPMKSKEQWNVRCMSIHTQF